ncbi:hypothetical protein MIR68_011725 [Amoeboaphelidium protococcarum]|nr:hypothetical protein MIR68_011725 [Amoeboaphelidium protococcarum]
MDAARSSACRCKLGVQLLQGAEEGQILREEVPSCSLAQRFIYQVVAILTWASANKGPVNAVTSSIGEVIPIRLPAVCNGAVYVQSIKITRQVSAHAKHTSDGNQNFVTRAELIESQKALVQYLDIKFASVDNKSASVDKKLASLDQKFDEVKQETRQIRKDLDVVKNLNANISPQLGGNFEKFSKEGLRQMLESQGIPSYGLKLNYNHVDPHRRVHKNQDYFKLDMFSSDPLILNEFKTYLKKSDLKKVESFVLKCNVTEEVLQRKAQRYLVCLGVKSSIAFRVQKLCDDNDVKLIMQVE